MNKVILTGGPYTPEETLLCPHCRFEYLHHEHVVVKCRSEDKGGIVVNIGGEIVTTRSEKESAFEGRRESVWIKFSCEGCDNQSWLSILQHKGHTFIEWSESPPTAIHGKTATTRMIDHE